MFLLDWLINRKWFCHIKWGGMSDHAHYEHPLDREPSPPPQQSLWD